MNTIGKALIGTAAAGAMTLASATPAMARDHRDGDGISAGEVIAGALVLGGIAAVVASANNRDDRYDRYDRRYDDRYGDRYGYSSRYSSRQAVEQCVRAAEATANRYSRGHARVTDVRDIDRTRDGYRVKGTLIVNERNRGWSRDYNYRGQGRDYDRGGFSCYVRNGRVVDVDYSGIRGLR